MGISEATFIYLGLTKEKWPHLTPETIQGFLEEPDSIGDCDSDFAQCFFKYYDWYWSENERL